MSVHVKCDRCGTQAQVSGVMLFAGLTGPAIPTARPELPDGWRRPRIPHEDGSSWDRELCPACMSDLTRFMEGCTVGDKPARDRLATWTNAAARKGRRPMADEASARHTRLVVDIAWNGPDSGRLARQEHCYSDSELSGVAGEWIEAAFSDRDDSPRVTITSVSTANVDDRAAVAAVGEVCDVVDATGTPDQQEAARRIRNAADGGQQ